MANEARSGDDKRKVIIIHGNGGSTGSDNWFPWLKRELEARGVTAVAETMPDNIKARAAIWLPHLERVLHADAQTVLVGHSSGAVAAMRYAETHRILGSVLVGAYASDLGDADERASGYFDQPWNWGQIKQNQQWIIQFASPSDPYIPIEDARLIHDRLNTIYFEPPTGGHFGEDVGLTEFPELLRAILTQLGLA